MPRGPRNLHHHIKRVHDFFFPHERNAYKPHVFSAWSIGIIALGLIAVHALYFTDTRIVFKKTDFLASVLPGVLTDLTNKDRAQYALTPVTYDTQLAQAAQLAVNDMASKGYFAHNSPEGKTPWYWLKQAGYQYSYAGQNLAVNFTDSKEVNQAWLNSPTHRANIMKGEYSRVGIAVANGTYKGKEATFVVQYFATPPAGVASAGAPLVATQRPVSAPPANTSDRVLGAADPESAITPTPATPVSQTDTPRPASTPSTEAPGSAGSSSTTTQAVGSAAPVNAPTINVASEAAQSNLFSRVATSPHRLLLAILTFLMAATIVLLAFAIGTHLRHQFVEVVGGGLALLAFVTVLTLVSMFSPTRVEVAPGGESAVESTQIAV